MQLQFEKIVNTNTYISIIGTVVSWSASHDNDICSISIRHITRNNVVMKKAKCNP